MMDGHQLILQFSKQQLQMVLLEATRRHPDIVGIMHEECAILVICSTFSDYFLLFTFVCAFVATAVAFAHFRCLQNRPALSNLQRQRWEKYFVGVYFRLAAEVS